MEHKFKVSGMTCASCQAHVEKAVKKVDGVNNVSVSLLTNSMVVDTVESMDLNKITKAVSNAGYKAKLENAKEEDTKELDTDSETKALLKRLIISIILLIPLSTISMLYMLEIVPELMNYSYAVGFTGFVLSTLIVIINRNFFISGTKALIHKAPNMDTLVSLGASISYVYSFILYFLMTLNVENAEYSMSLSMNISFETCGMILTFITIGKTLEAYSKGKTTSALKSLMKLSPKKANKVVGNSIEVIDVKDIKVDDIIRVNAGDRVAIDGIIVSGESTLDESLLTGESIPLDKTVGDLVYQGTINKLGTLDVKAIKEDKDTTLSNIIKLVDEASNSKAKISRIADKISGVFVPIVLGIALVTFIVWYIIGLNGLMSYKMFETSLTYALNKAISVLVISCPCGLGLATPVAIMVGSGRSAKNNILFKNAESLEETSKVKFVVLDKTGTITKGKPEIKNIKSYIDETEFKTIAASLESYSSHPLANAISSGIDSKRVEVTNVKTLVSIGIEGYIDTDYILASNMDYAKDNNLVTESEYKEAYNMALNGETPVMFFKNKKLIGIISLKDPIKEDSVEAINKIKALGINVIMLTGDNKVTSKSIASEANIEYYVSGVTPSVKADVVKKLKNYGSVLMCGDGINDSIALTSADVGVAIGTGSDVAIDSAQVVLMKSSLMDLYKAIRLSQKTYKNILENLFWAFIYNLIMIPIASGVFEPLGVDLKAYYGALAMSLSSVTVVLNALRLNIVNIEKTGHTRQVKQINLDEILNNTSSELEITIKVDGMMCEHCVATVENICKKDSNVISATASLENKNVIIKYTNQIDIDELIKEINDADYTASKE